jgi:hypothetical protein
MNTQEKLDPDFKAKWVAALRSGEYKQNTDGTLYNRNECSHCCLAVAIELLGHSFKDNFKEADDYKHLPISIQYCEGKAGDHLVSMNDSGKSFEEIADYIEANL